jgi:hypothetical protein
MKTPSIAASNLRAPFIKLSVQFTILTVAGKEIITVKVLNKALLL